MKIPILAAALFGAVVVNSAACAAATPVVSPVETLFAGYPTQASQHALRELEPALFVRANLDRETGCLATALYFEARGESREGQTAVAQVILNRQKSKAYPDTICEVVWQNSHKTNRCQFSFTCDEQTDRVRDPEAWHQVKLLALSQTCERKCNSMENSGRPVESLDKGTQRATHYHADYVSPAWGPKLERMTQIGRHIFYVSPRVEKTMPRA